MKAVLFDFGGTIDTGGVHWSEQFRELYERFGLRPARGEFDAAFAGAERELARDPDMPSATFRATLEKQLTLQFAILGLRGDPGLAGRMADACHADVARCISGQKKLLGDLSSRHRLALVSNFYGNLDVVCREFGIDPYFTATVDSAVAGVRKPDPAIFALALGKLGVSAAEAAVVGDSYDRDIVPGKSLGCRTVWLKGKSWTSPASAEAADFTIQRLEELRPILLGPE